MGLRVFSRKRIEDTATSGQIFVCTHPNCQKKGSDATIGAFRFLAPSNIHISACNCLGGCNKGPIVKILTPNGTTIIESMIRSVDKVVDVLQNDLNVSINTTSAQVLRLNYEGNIYLRGGAVDHAIDCYDRALALGEKDQEGILLVMRGTALLQRAYAMKIRIKDLLTSVSPLVPQLEEFLYRLLVLSQIVSAKVALVYLSQLPRLSSWAEMKAKWPEAAEGPLLSADMPHLLDRMIFLSALHDNALWRALQDLLTATILIPTFPQAWRRAGDALVEARRFADAIEHYAVAMKLDSSLEGVVLPAIHRARVLEQLARAAERKGWPADALHSLLDDL